MNDPVDSPARPQCKPDPVIEKPAVLGRMAEEAAADWFARAGYRLLARNYSVARTGEIDLVLFKDDLLTIVEVKARRSADRFGGPAAAITRKKRQKLGRMASHFLQHQGFMNKRVQFLAALVQIDHLGNCLGIEVIAFDLT